MLGLIRTGMAATRRDVIASPLALALAGQVYTFDKETRVLWSEYVGIGPYSTRLQRNGALSVALGCELSKAESWQLFQTENARRVAAIPVWFGP